MIFSRNISYKVVASVEKLGERGRNSLQSRSWEENGRSGGGLRGIRYRSLAFKTALKGSCTGTVLLKLNELVQSPQMMWM